jgi:fructokinase
MSFSVVGIGEVLWDLLPGGPQLGGAPANFACHARALGADASVVTRVGDDELGHRILDRFRKMCLPLNTVQVDPVAPTGTASVTLNPSGIPQFHLQENVAWDRLVVTEHLLNIVQTADAICFGTLAQRGVVSRSAIQRLLAVASADALRIFDVNLRGSFYSRDVIDQSLALANVLKLNSDELPILGEMFSIGGGTPRSQIQSLAKMFQLRIVALTCGEKGSLIYAEGVWSEQVPAPTPVVDTVGAGDSFTAALVMGLLAGMPLQDAHAFANEVSTFVCSQPGATPALPQAFRNRCQNLPLALPPRTSE